MLTFDAATHTYKFSGIPVPGVTSLLEPLHSFTGVPWDVLEAARERGTDVHHACELFDLGELDVEHLKAEAPYLVGYVEGWKKFTRDCEPIWLRIEDPVYHPLYKYAGTPDRTGDLLFEGIRVEDSVVDIKTPLQSHPVWGIQTAAYREAAKCKGRRFTVQLRADGTYKILEWTDPADWPAFVSLTTLRTWKEKHRL